ncbi:MAG: PepSY domain-containing protein [Pseudomonadota bacterium]
MTAGGMYRRVWRWHFYAGLVCLPFVFSLALTGALYLFHDRIDDLVYADLLLVPAASVQNGAAAIAPGRLIERALRFQPGQPKAITLPDPDDRRHSTQVDIVRPDGGTQQVFLDQGSGAVLGGMAESQRLMAIVKHLHSLALAGDGGRIVIEVVAGWIVLLMLSGTYLWWPRGRKQGVLTIRPSASGRIWWRDLHAVTGVFAAPVILFLALSGMPWSIFWGEQVNRWISAHGLGAPPGMWSGLPLSSLPARALGDMPWTLQRQPVPASVGAAGADPHAAHRAAAPAQADAARGASDAYRLLGNAAALTPDRAVATLRAVGLAGGYRLVLPRDARGVYSAIRMPGRQDEQRVIHLDQYSGKILFDVGAPGVSAPGVEAPGVGASRIGPFGRAIQWGVSVHQGGEYGTANRLLMLAACLATMALCVSGVLTWWKRRPPGRLAAPPRREDDRLTRGVIGIVVLCAIVFPLLGASILLASLVDCALTRRARRHC